MFRVILDFLILCRSNNDVLPIQCFHICRLKTGLTSLRSAWADWIRICRDNNTLPSSSSMLNPLLISLLRPSWTSSNYPAEAPIHIVATTLWHKFCIRDMHHYTPEAFPLFQMPRMPCSRRLFEGSVRIAVTKRHGKAVNQRDASDPGLWIDAIRHSLGAEIFSLSRLEFSTAGWPPPAGADLEQYISSKIATNRVKYSDSNFYCHDSEELPHIVLCLGGPKDVLAEFWRLAGSIIGVVNIIILIKSKIPFVTPNWLTNSYVESKILPPEEYNLNSSLLKAADRIVENWRINGSHYLTQIPSIEIPPTAPILSQQQHIAELNSLTLTSFSSFLDKTSVVLNGSIILTSIPGIVTNCLLAFLELNCGPKLMSWTNLLEIPDEFAYIRFLVVEKKAVRFCPYFNDTPAQPIIVIVQPEEVLWISDFYEALCHSLATYFQSTTYLQSKCHHQHDALGRLTVFLAARVMQKARELIRISNLVDVLDIARSLLLVVNEAKISKSKELKLIVSDQVIQETNLHQKQQQLVLVAISRWLSGVLVENLENQLENCAIAWKVKTYIEALKITSKFKTDDEPLSQEIVPVEAEPHNSLNHV